MFPENQCLLCDGKASLYLFNSVDARIECPKCGRFKVARMLYTTVLQHKNSDASVKELLPYVSAHTRQASERGEEIFLENSNWKDFALAHKNTPISRKATKLLELIAARSAYGHSTKLDQVNDLSLVDAKDLTEFTFLLKHLTELGYIIRSGDALTYGLKVKGWEQLQPTAGIPGKCFVAISFDEELKKPVWEEGIEPAVRVDCKMDPVRIDLVPHNDNIVDKIIAEIQTCQFMVADFTGNKAGVYFEAGFAKGLGRPVIWTCRKNDFEKVHFDIAQFSHIIWKDPGDFRMRLADRIKATIR